MLVMVCLVASMFVMLGASAEAATVSNLTDLQRELAKADGSDEIMVIHIAGSIDAKGVTITIPANVWLYIDAGAELLNQGNGKIINYGCLVIAGKLNTSNVYETGTGSKVYLMGGTIDGNTNGFSPVYVSQNPLCFVTFVDWDGIALKSTYVIRGSDAVAPANPVRDGYSFDRWDADFTSVQSDLIVTAIYTKDPVEPEKQTFTVYIQSQNGGNTGAKSKDVLVEVDEDGNISLENLIKACQVAKISPADGWKFYKLVSTTTFNGATIITEPTVNIDDFVGIKTEDA